VSQRRVSAAGSLVLCHYAAAAWDVSYADVGYGRGHAESGAPVTLSCRRVFDQEEANKNAVRCRHDCTHRPLPLDIVWNLVSADIRSERDYSGFHHGLGARVDIVVERLRRHQAEHNAVLIRDDADVPLTFAQSIAHDADALIDPACWNIPTGNVRDARHIGLGSLAGQPCREPVSLSSLIPIHARESERLEPRRGPRAHISLVVVAVHDHGPVRVEPPHGLAAERL
jgi:hypothetical protein